MKTSIPAVDCYSKLGAVFSILQPHTRARPWLYYNFTHLVYFYEELTRHSWVDLCSEVFPIFAHEWEACPFLEFNTYLYSEELRSNIVSLILSAIDLDQFIYLTVNRKFISELKEKDDFIHDMLIVGYDRTDNKFLCRDFFYSKYSELWIPFEKIKEAFRNNPVPGQNDPLGKVYTLRYKENETFPIARTMSITKELAIRNIKQIVEGRFDVGSSLLNANGTECFYDLNVYGKLAEHIKTGMTDLNDIRPFYAIKSHIKLLTDQSEFWEIGSERKRESLRKSAEAMCYQSLKTSLQLCQKKGGTVGNEKLESLLKEVRQAEYNFILSI